MSTLTINSWTKFWSISGFISLLACVYPSESVMAQVDGARSGVSHLSHWPDDAERSELYHDILPFIDTLTVAYFYDVVDGRPVMSLRMEWTPDDEVIFRGRRVPASDVSGEILMAAVDLRADVLVRGRRVGGLIVDVDSMQLGFVPDFVDVELPDLTWENVFTEITAEEARSAFSSGFELTNLDIASAVFTVVERSGSVRPAVGRPQPRPVTIYRAPDFVDVLVDISWLIGRPSFDFPPSGNDGRRTAAGRGGLDDEPRSRSGRSSSDGRSRDVGRGEPDGSQPGGEEPDGSQPGGEEPDGSEPGREDSDEVADRDRDGSRDGKRRDSSRGEDRDDGGLFLPGSDSDEEDDDDEDESLVPYAIAAAGAAGILAAVGGTIGYYGNAEHAPIGLTSGIVRRQGGLLLQVAVNEALISGGDGPQNLVAKLLTFGNLFDASIQPALGAGVLATTRDGGEAKVEPSLSLGAVTTRHVLMLYAGYDVLQNGPEFSVALNIHQLLRGGNR